jgi:hypothetical protein
MRKRSARSVDKDKKPTKRESLNEKARRLNCVHLWNLVTSGKCEGCGLTPLSPRLGYLEREFNREG